MLEAREPVRGREGEKGSVCVCVYERKSRYNDRKRERERGGREGKRNKCQMSYLSAHTDVGRGASRQASCCTYNTTTEQGKRGRGP